MPDPSALLSLHIGPAAHGGHCVARHEDRVVFVRHTLPGERVLAAVTARNRRYWRADAVQVLHASPDRVPSAWPAAGPGGVGGGELAHVALPAQRAWKAAVIGEQLARIARLPGAEVAVQALPGEDERGGLGYRTRIDLVAGVDGRPGMHRHRAAEVLALDSMPLAVPQLAGLGLFERRFAPGARVRAVAPGDGPPVVLVDGVPVAADGSAADVRLGRSRYVREVVGLPGVAEWRYRVSAEGFWQVHRGAAPVLVAAVVGALTGLDLAGQVVVDLYSGVGLFSLPLADLVGPSGRVVSVEGDPAAVRNARRNAHDRPQVQIRAGAAEQVAAAADCDSVAAVVLDPPRAGARAAVVAAVARLRPRRIVYVACDPAALARDVALFGEHAYQLDRIEAFDLFPMTHHVECVAVLTKRPDPR